MPYLYLIFSVFCNASTSIFGTYFKNKTLDKKDASAFYNFLQLFAVFIGWLIIFIFDYSFNVQVLPYSLLFAVFFTICNISLIHALKNGPASLTSLFISLSMIITSVWSCIFWKNPFTVNVGIGLVATILSLFFCLYNGKNEEKFSWKWLIFAFLAMLGNAGCSIVQRTQQMQFNYQYGNMMMTFATFFSMLGCLFVFLRSDKTDSPALLKKTWYLPTAAGACNVLLNLFVMLLANTALSPSLIYPTIGVGGLVVVMLFSLIAFKEKLNKLQWIGIVVGAIATIFLSL